MKKKIYFFLILAAMFSSVSVFAQDITSGLQLHYTFDNVDGTTVPDASGKANAGTLVGAAALAEGKTGQAVSLMAVDDYVQLPNDFTTQLTDYTVACWVNLATINYWGRIFDFGNGTAVNMFMAPQNGYPYYAIKQSNEVGEQSVKSNKAIKVDTWTHVAVTSKFDEITGAGVLTIYINGVPAGSNAAVTTTPASMGTTLQNYIGKSQYADPTINGRIDDFRVYSRALTADDMLALNGIPTQLINAFKSFTISGNLSEVTENLTLPTTAGTDGVTVSWVSNDSTAVHPDGTVTRPEKYKAAVKLTATLSYTSGGNTYTLQKIYDVIVLPMSDASEYVAIWKFTDDKITTLADGTVTVTDESDNAFVGTLKGGAQIVKIGNEQKINVLSLYKNGEYFDMGTAIGEAVYGLTDYTVGIFYRKDSTGGLTKFTGYGQWLYGFTNTLDLGANAIGAMYFEPLRGRHVNTPDNYGAEGANNVGTGEGVVPIGTWHHVCYSQTAGVGKLYFDGVEVKSGTMQAPSVTLKRAGKKGTAYNMIGKAGYTADPGLSNTLIWGFQMYSVGLTPDDMVQEMDIATNISILDNAFNSSPYNIYTYATLEGLLKTARETVKTGYQPALDALNAAITAGQAALDNQAPTNELNQSLTDAIAAYNTAQTKWLEFAKVIKSTDEYVAKNYPGLPDFQLAISQAKAQYDAFNASDELINTLKAAIATYVQSQAASKENPMDYTWSIVNPSFEEGTGGKLDSLSYRDGKANGNGKYEYPKGWTVYVNHNGWCNAAFIPEAPAHGTKSYETWAATITEFNVYQDIDLPAGNYVLSAQMRTNAGAPYTQHIYATTKDGKTWNSQVLDETKVITGSGWNGLGNWQTMYCSFTSTGGKTRVGFNANGFMQFDNMRLAYYGSDKPGIVDFTAKLANPGFEEGATTGVDSISVKAKGGAGDYFRPVGWNVYCNIDTTSGWANLKGISGNSMAEGSKGFEAWTENGKFKEANVYQTITAPATGYYMLTAKMRCNDSSPSSIDTLVRFDGRIYAKVANFGNVYSKKIGEIEGLNVGAGWDTKDAWRTLTLIFQAGVGETIKLGAISSSFMQLDDFTLKYYAVADPNAVQPAKKVGYYTLQKTMDAAAATVQNDPIYRMLSADEKLAVTLNVVTDNTVNSPIDMTPYDVIIVQESFGGADKILTPAGPLGLAKFTLPTLYNKSYAFKTGRALTAGGSATGAETEGVFTLQVDAANRTNTLFNGITMTDGAFPLFTIGATDAGSGDGTKNKALNFANGVTGVDGTLLAYPTGSTPSISVNDIPAGTTIGDQVTQARIITFGMNFGAMCRDNGANITNENYTLWRNAVYMLAGLEVPTTIVGNKNVSVKTTVDIYPNPVSDYLNIRGIDAMSSVKVFNALGQQVFVTNSTGDAISIDLSKYNKGIYMLQVESNGKAVTSKFLKK